MKSSQARAARRALDRRLSQFPSARQFTTPPRGWIRAIREALGMSSADLSSRLGITPASVSDMERSERDRRIRLDTLARAADALDCDLVYVFLPRSSLTEAVEREATLKVTRHVTAVSRAMDLESQSADIDDDVIREEVHHLIDSGQVWK